VWYFHPSSRAHIPVSTASGICHTITAICRYRGRVGTGLSVLWVAYTAAFYRLFEKEESFVSNDRKMYPNETAAIQRRKKFVMFYLVIIDVLLSLIACSEQRG
jgi:hypothetical protein